MDKLSEIIETDVDQLISDLIGSMPISSSETEHTSELYQLPVRHTRGGEEINEENKPWIVGTFIPNQYVNETHPHGHMGVDLKAPSGSPIYPIASGIVTDVGTNEMGGNYIITTHEDGKVRVYYAHLLRVNVGEGTAVNQDTVIGEMGETGNAKGRGAHLHYEVSVDGKKINPQSIVGKRVGSLSKKAAFVKLLVAELDKRYEASSSKERTRALKKIAAELNLDFNLTPTEQKIFALLRSVVSDKAPNTELRVAGGWVRDKLLGKESHDIDISVNNMSGLAFASMAREWMKEHGIPVPKSVAVVEANPDAKKSLETAILPIYGIPIDFVQLRADEYDYKSRKPKIVVGVSPEEDAKRRDLTINSIFYNINDDKIEDFVGGVEDLKNGIARTPLDPYNTFMEDPLRILRAVRFAAKYDLKIDPALIEAANNTDVQESFRTKISKERIWKELVGQQEGEGWKRGLMVGPNFDRAAELMGTMGLRDLILSPTDPVLEKLRERKDVDKLWEREVHPWTMDQNNPYHNLNVWEHTLKALNYMKQIHESNVSEGTERKIEDQVVRNLSMLLHDIGKCDVCSQQLHEKGYTTYHGHERSSAVMADELLRELRAPNHLRQRVVNLIKNHMRLHGLPSGSRGAGLRRVLRDVGVENWPLLVEMSKSDSMGKKETELDPKYDRFAEHITNYLENTAGKAEISPPLNGHDIMQILGLKSGGPAIGNAMRALKEAMLENPELSKEEAIAIVESMKQ